MPQEPLDPASIRMAGDQRAGCAMGCAGRAVGTLTRWRSRRAAWDSRLRRRPEPTTCDISVGSSSRHTGLVGAGGGGAGAGPLAVLCVVRAAGVERYERGVLVVSIDRLVPVLWEVANGAERSQPTPLHGLSVL